MVMDNDASLIERVARLEEQYRHLIRELDDIKSSIREINIVTKYVIPILLVVTWVVSIVR
ncbi:MAG: hypothetical protein QXH51_07490 [Candidatus Bathyarchaeia archaeon]